MGSEPGGDDLNDGFQLQEQFSASEEGVDAVVQDLTKKKKRKRKSENTKAIKVGYRKVIEWEKKL